MAGGMGGLRFLTRGCTMRLCPASMWQGRRSGRPVEDEPRVIGLLDIPRLPRPPSEPLLRALLAPYVLLVMVIVLIPRLLLVAVLLVLRFVMVVAYNSYSRAPGPIGCLVLIPALAIYFILGLFRTVFSILLDWNLALSGMDLSQRMRYVAFIIGPVIGTQD